MTLKIIELYEKKRNTITGLNVQYFCSCLKMSNFHKEKKKMNYKGFAARFLEKYALSW